MDSIHSYGGREPLTILFVITTLGLGGAERQVVLLAEELTRRGHRIGIVSLLPIGLLGRLGDSGSFAVFSLGMRRAIPDPRAIGRLRRIVQEFRPDVVHSHMIHANILARVAVGGMPSRPLVCTAHSTDEGRGWRVAAYRLTHGRAALTTNVSRAGVHHFEVSGAVPPGAMIPMPNGVRVPSSFPRHGSPDGRPFRWVCIARCVPEKGLDVLLHSLVGRERELGHLTVVGDGPLRGQLEALANSLGLGRYVTWAGADPAVAPFLAAADGLVLASRLEGFPMVILEAGAAGLPVVATDVGGIGEALAGGRGIVVAPEDHRALADGMRTMERLGAGARHEMALRWYHAVKAEFAIEVVAARWIGVYHACLARRQA
jgi:glycosyltransferase involved in cell wall biosynthesis